MQPVADAGHNADFETVNAIARDELRDARCSECGGVLRNGESCANRFAELLALDHSRQEPWASRHGIAFAVFTLQHSRSAPPDSLEQCWGMLQRVFVHGDDRADVTRGLRSRYQSARGGDSAKQHAARSESWDTLPLPSITPQRFATTIQDMGSFDAATYAADLDAWCMATINAWNSTND